MLLSSKVAVWPHRGRTAAAVIACDVHGTSEAASARAPRETSGARRTDAPAPLAGLPDHIAPGLTDRHSVRLVRTRSRLHRHTGSTTGARRKTDGAADGEQMPARHPRRHSVSRRYLDCASAASQRGTGPARAGRTVGVRIAGRVRTHPSR